MSMTKMSVAQYDDLRKAQAAGDKVRAQAILDMGYQPDYDPTLVEATEAEILGDEPEVPHEDILQALHNGLSDAEIMAKFKVSGQVLNVIKGMMPKQIVEKDLPGIPGKDLDTDAVLNDVAAGMENKEITEKHGISAQKLGAIKKGAK